MPRADGTVSTMMQCGLLRLPTGVMTPADDFSAVPPFEIRTQRRAARSLRLQLPAQRPPLSRALPGHDAARPQRDPPLRGLLSSTSCSARPWRSARRCWPPISRAPISTSTASPGNSTRACSPSRCRPSPTSARRASPAGSAPCRARRRGARHLSRPAAARRGARRASRPSTSPITTTLKRLVAGTHARFGFAVLIDCHSMPAIDPRRRQRRAAGLHHRRPLRHSAAPALTEQAIGLLIAMGYTVAHNKPYAGGFITEHYGRPARGLHALQIEVNRGLYMNERTLQKSTRLRCAGRRPGALLRRPDGDPGLSSSATCRSPPNSVDRLRRARQKKTASFARRGRSLGRKRPRRAWTGRTCPTTNVIVRCTNVKRTSCVFKSE